MWFSSKVKTRILIETENTIKVKTLLYESMIQIYYLHFICRTNVFMPYVVSIFKGGSGIVLFRRTAWWRPQTFSRGKGAVRNIRYEMKHLKDTSLLKKDFKNAKLGKLGCPCPPLKNVKRLPDLSALPSICRMAEADSRIARSSCRVSTSSSCRRRRVTAGPPSRTTDTRGTWNKKNCRHFDFSPDSFQFQNGHFIEYFWSF